MLTYNEIAVTNRRLCPGDFLAQVAKIAAREPWAILLREKDLDAAAYKALALRVKGLCGNVPLIAHTYPVEGLPFHMPLASVHSIEEARRAEAAGARFVIAGHIFATQSKPGLPPRGLDFLRGVCESVGIPVFAIGGITERNAAACIAAGAFGICRMSYWMNLES